MRAAGAGFLRSWRLAWRITKLNFRARLEYRAEFLMMIGVGAAWQLSIVVFATVLLTRFPGMGGWENTDVLLMASMRLVSRGLYGLLLGRMTAVVFLVQEGRFDSYLLRPMPVHRQLQLTFFSVHSIGDLAVALTLFVPALWLVEIDWTPLLIGYLVAAIVGGMLVEGMIFTVLGSAALHAPATAYWTNWLDELTTAYGNYPLHILPGLARDLMTFLLPLAFVAYLPAAVLTQNQDTLAVPGWLAWASPLFGLLGYLGARRLWTWSLRQYKGVGTA